MSAAAAAGVGAEAQVDDRPSPSKRPRLELEGALAPLTSDVSFKRAFVNEGGRESLKHLLNAVMRGPAGSFEISAIENVEIKDPLLRSIVFDVRCKLTSGDKVIVELQKTGTRTRIVDRIYGYQANDYTQQWGRGGTTEAPEKGEYMLVPVRVLALLDFCVDTDRAKCGSLVQHYHIQHDTAKDTQVPAPAVAERLRALSDITIVQLPLAPKVLEDGMSDAEKWAHLLHSTEDYTFDSLPPQLKMGPFIAAAKSACIDTMTLEERNALGAQLDDLRMWRRKDADLEAAKKMAAEAKLEAAEAKEREAEAKEREAEAKEREASVAKALADARAEIELLKAKAGEHK